MTFANRFAAVVSRVWDDRLLPRLVAERAHATSALPTDEACRALLLPCAGALAWLGLLGQAEGQEGRAALARRALEREGHKTPSPDWVARLATALPGRLLALADEIGLAQLPLSWLLVPREEEGGFFLDTRVARHFEKQGALDLAGVVRQKSQAVWAQYQTALASPFATPSAQARLCGSLWWLFAHEDFAREGLPPLAVAVLLGRNLLRAWKTDAPQVPPAPTPTKTAPAEASSTPHAPDKATRVRASTRLVKPVPTLALPVAEDLGRFSAHRGLSLSEDKTRVLREGELLAPVNVATLEKKYLVQLNEGLRRHRWGNLTFRRTVNYLVRACYERYLSNEARPDVLEFQSLAHFAECIGETTCEGASHLLEILVLGQVFSLSWPGGYLGGLWTFHYRRACRGRPSWLEIRVSRVLEPHYGMGILDSPWRVPVVKHPKFCGRHNDHAAQAALSERLLIELVDRRLELVRDGGALLPKAHLQRLCDQFGVQTSPGKLVSCWEVTDEAGEAYLERQGDRFHLAKTPSYEGARDFLTEAGQRSLDAKEAARRGLAAQQRKRQGKGRRK